MPTHLPNSSNPCKNMSSPHNLNNWFWDKCFILFQCSLVFCINLGQWMYDLQFWVCYLIIYLRLICGCYSSVLSPLNDSSWDLRSSTCPYSTDDWSSVVGPFLRTAAPRTLLLTLSRAKTDKTNLDDNKTKLSSTQGKIWKCWISCQIHFLLQKSLHIWTNE